MLAQTPERQPANATLGRTTGTNKAGETTEEFPRRLEPTKAFQETLPPDETSKATLTP
jgi:hypothetical protein